MLGTSTIESKNDASAEFQRCLTLAHQGNTQAQAYIGWCYQNGHRVKRDDAQAFFWYQKAADHGHAGGQTSLGNCYKHGRGVKQDYAQAFAWYQKAADQGNAAGQTNLGNCYLHGRGVKQDDAQAFAWYQKAADQGHASGQINLGGCYLDGRGVKQDHAQAFAWYQKAAAQGHAGGQANLGRCYEDGWGVKQDYAQAFAWYQKAAAQGSADGQNNLAICYENGAGVAKDLVKAFEWYQKAALQGYTMAQRNVGECYEKGIGIKQDYAQAMVWYQKAAAQGNDYAKARLEALTSLERTVGRRPSIADKSDEKASLTGSFAIPYNEITFGKELGRGGVGIVYQATWRHSPVAVKQFLSTNLSPAAQEEFKTESAIMARLRAPNIVQFYGYCVSPQYCLVMEYLPKGSLFNLLHSKDTLDWSVRYRLVTDMACGLAFLHTDNILHRDIKSLNVLLDEHHHAKLSDFGLPTIKSETKSAAKGGGTVGSLPWMAPELLQHQAVYTQKTDIYSLGVTFWEVASRKTPFRVAQGKREDIPNDCPKKIASLIRFCWKGKPENRPDAGQIVGYLRSDKDDFGQFVAAAGSASVAEAGHNNLASGNVVSYKGNLASASSLCIR